VGALKLIASNSIAEKTFSEVLRYFPW